MGLHGDCKIIRYHLGTVALGALVIGLSRPLRCILGVLTAGARSSGGGCLVDFYRDYLDHISADAYAEVVLGSNSFWVSTMKGGASNREYGHDVHILHGAAFIFQVLGCCLAFIVGYGVTMGMVQSWFPGCDDYQNPFSVQYVSAPGWWSVCGGIVAVAFSFPFMTVIDIIADTILYCTILEVKLEKQKLSEHGSCTNDSYSDFFSRILNTGCFGRRLEQTVVARP